METNHSRETALKHAVDEGKMGGIAAPHEELILEYYNDVHEISSDIPDSGTVECE
jgi:hypothetical protein